MNRHLLTTQVQSGLDPVTLRPCLPTFSLDCIMRIPSNVVQNSLPECGAAPGMEARSDDVAGRSMLCMPMCNYTRLDTQALLSDSFLSFPSSILFS